ncbi:MAG: transglutaminase-like domain-containing protein [Peptoniphilaceae bacterium]|nr:transglutaminase-like domain-containing protein [Peptoniphilaceae bacterium]MDY6146313.1 transglutaminase-like domain-containing protein [Peptoniphilaceae bacterium]
MNTRYWRQWLQAWLTTGVFATCLCYFLFRLLEVPPELLEIALWMLGTTLIFGIVITFWRYSLPFLGIVILIFGLQFLTGRSLGTKYLSMFYWQGILREALYSLRWAITLNELKPAMPAIFPIVAYLIIAFISVLSNWVLPIPLLNMVFLMAPLFYIPGLTEDPKWLAFLMLGLFCVYASYAFRQDPSNHEQRPPIIFGLILIALTLLLQWIIPADFFFNEKLSEQLNRWRPVHIGADITSFSLKELGFYPQGNLRVGGPVELSQDPYLEITADPTAFYLRGASYDAFDGNSWSLSEPQYLNAYRFESNFFDDFSSDSAKVFWFGGSQIRDEVLQKGILTASFYRIRTIKPTRNVFHGGKPMAMTLLKAVPPAGVIDSSTIEQLDAKKAFFYSQNGMLASEQDYNQFGIYTQDFVFPVQNDWAGEMLSSYEPKRKDAPKKLEAAVREKDPELAKILYDQDMTFSSRISLMREHFRTSYTYDLKASAIPDGELFIDNFLTNKKGYCVYFATAWSILLRDIGYETRYAEGFLVPQASADQSVSTRTLTGNNAHAWTEIYVDGIGWLPLEATPESHIASISNQIPNDPKNTPPQESSSQESSKNETSEQKSSSEQNSESKQDISSQEPQTSDSSADNGRNDASKSFFSALWNALKGILWIVLIVALIAFACVTWLKGKMKCWNARYHADFSGFSGSDSQKRQITIKMWKHIQRISGLLEVSLEPTDTVRSTVEKIWKILKANDLKDVHEISGILERVIYTKYIPTTAEMNAIQKVYRSVSKQYRNQTDQWDWLTRDVLWIAGHPW